MNTKEMLTAYMTDIEHWALDEIGEVEILDIKEAMMQEGITYIVTIQNLCIIGGKHLVYINISDVLCWLASKITKMRVT